MVNTDSSTVTLAVSDPSGATLNGALTVAAVNGVATFSDLSLPVAGSYTLLATDSALSPATSGPFTVTNALFTVNGNGTMIANGDSTPGTTDSTDFGPAPLNHVNGAVTRTYTIQSIANATVTLTGNPVISGPNAADFTVSAQPSLSIGAGGSTTFTISFSPTIAGAESAVVSFSSSDGSQSPFTFDIQGQGLSTTTAADNLQIATMQAGYGSSAMAGQVLNVLYTGSLLDGTVFDASSLHGNTPFTLTLGAGDVIPGWDEGLVGMLVGESRMLIIPSALGYGASGSGSIPPNATLIFQVQLLSISGPTLGVTGEGNAIAYGDTTLSTTDGTSFGDVSIGSTMMHTFSLSNLASAGTLTLTGANPVQIYGPGANQFTVTQPSLDASQTGVFNVTYTPTTDELATATVVVTSNDPNHSSFTFNIAGETPAAATHLVFTQQPSNVPTGQTIAPALTVTLEDSSGNPITSSTSSVTLAIASGPNGAVLNGTTTVALQNGVATFSDLSINSAGLYTVVASSVSLNNTSSDSFVVGAMHLAFLQQPQAQATNQSIAPPVTVALEDEIGDIVPNGASSVTLAIASGTAGAVLGGTTTIAMQNGVATFGDLSINLGGSYTLAASDGALSGATSNSFVVGPLHLVFVQQPTNASAGHILSSVTVKLVDASGNIITSDNSNISLSIAGAGGATLGGTVTVAAQNGIATFSNMSITKAGTYALVATRGTLSSDANSSKFTISALAASKLMFGALPNVAAGSASSTRVYVTDAYGNVITGNSSTVKLTLFSGPTGKVPVSMLAKAVHGVATFSKLPVQTKAGAYRFKATATGLSSAASIAFTIRAAAPAKLAFGQQPLTTAAGHVIAPAVTVKVLDRYGNLVTTDSSIVKLVLGTTVAGAKLGGTLSVAAVAGVAVFNNLTLNKAGTYTLKAADGKLTYVLSISFRVK